MQIDFSETLLNRVAAAKALAEAGMPLSATTLATMATRGGGPVYRVFGNRAVYRRGDLLAWAHSRLSAPRRCTSELDAA